MESGAGSGEDGAAPESWTTLVREGCGEEAGALREHSAGGEVGALQAVGAGAVAVAVAVAVAAEPVWEAEARQARGEAGLGAELVVLVEDTVAAPDLGTEEDEGDEGQEDQENAEDERKHTEVVECPEEAEEGYEEEAAEGQAAEEVKEEGEKDDKEESVEEEAKEGDEQLKEEEEPEGDSVEEGAKAEEAKEEDFEEQVAEDVEAEAEAEAEEGKREEAREGSQKEEEAQELQEKQEGEEERGARPGPPPSPLQALQALQSELEPLNKDASRAYSRLKLRFWQRRRHHLEHRSALIRGIPGFWAKAFVNHPQLSAMLRGQDKGILVSMTDLQVEELEPPRDRRKILLFFRKNSYFHNEVVEKEYVLRAAGYEPSHSTPIQWHRNYEREARSRRHHNSSLNFFNWFSDHSFAGSSRIAEIVMDDLWPNPLQYYMRKKAPAEGTERRAGSFKKLR
ncbi:testis-specific Y-encoded protein 3-like [Mustela lutreola]|uniref:testis-specific Y-encoded protein 3-like n=1 Tax=Mustela lutreola TaxID=9666 RepID=UPI00279732CF|nr:testis-specific Y-encoded protein 3-like [Mustela lutreola]